MIFEHEIPSGSKLYFGQSAKVKREIEFISAEMLENLGFEEIVTPIFSYHQQEAFEDKKPLLKLNDESNHEVTLRADSTSDVVRIVTKRLGRSSEAKKWFYIQPTLSFPTIEQYKIGGEIIDGNFEEIAKTTIMLLKEIEITPIMQISNIKIPHLLNEKYGVSLDSLKSMNIEKIMALDFEWIEPLVKMSKVSDLEDLSLFPEDIKIELEKIKEATSQVDYERMIISPLFYAKMRYYDSLLFRMFEENHLLAMGGIYKIDEIKASGFGLYTDECIINKMNRN